MRRIPRIARSIDLFDTPRRSSSASTLCRACQHRTAPPITVAAFSSASRRQIGDPEKAKPYTEKLRNKIWGTEVAPGQEDPYTRGSPWREPKWKNNASEQEQEPEDESEPMDVQPHSPTYHRPYVPAETSEGLQWVGGDKWLLKQKEKERPRFENAFLPGKENKAKTPDEITAAMRRALIEIFTARINGTDVDNRPKDWTRGFDIKPANNEHGVEITRKEVEHQTVKHQDTTWWGVSLVDPAVKFAFVSRVTQLTGLRIPDPVIGAATTVRGFINRIKPSEKPKKLAAVLQKESKLPDLINVTIKQKKVSNEAKWQQMGRWKVIKEELKKRNLFKI
ncbi:hypothetical protein K490DRAFT_68215 [Saccharata proteae CBS 121410]|uniref:Large ribosomal subunit protein mL50 n=1 Tax=Saccharata proteae CBS 121410 TaxID=1314787 RepID=A0A9P4HNM0_9PEZI|nr:hypothetical protein K490DRAFT_68215 [Saccharata proteae CBS 121410]